MLDKIRCTSCHGATKKFKRPPNGDISPVICDRCGSTGKIYDTGVREKMILILSFDQIENITLETYGEVYPAEEMEESLDDSVGMPYTVKKGTTTPSDNKYIDLLKSGRPQLHSLGLILNDLCRINVLVAGDYMVGGGHA